GEPPVDEGVEGLDPLGAGGDGPGPVRLAVLLVPAGVVGALRGPAAAVELPGGNGLERELLDGVVGAARGAALRGAPGGADLVVGGVGGHRGSSQAWWVDCWGRWTVMPARWASSSRVAATHARASGA